MERTVSIRAWYFDEPLDLKAFRGANPQYPVIRQEPLLIELERDRYAVLTKFGGVVFWNYDASAAHRLRDDIFPVLADRSYEDRIEDVIPVMLGAPQDKILPNAIHLATEDMSKVNIVSYAIAQSVALENFENKLDIVFKHLKKHIDVLRDRGRVTATAKEITKTVGFAMTAKHAILMNLTLFDKPDETWDSPELESLYHSLYNETFDLHDRVRAIDRKLEFLTDGVTLLLDLIQARKFMGLEVMIVILIFVEIVLYFIR